MNSFSFLVGACLLLVPLVLLIRRYGTRGGGAAVQSPPGVAVDDIVYRHVAVAVAVWPLAIGVSWVLAYLSAELAGMVRGFAASGALPGELALLALRVGQIPVDVTFLDVEAMACLLYTAYGVVLVQHRLIDVVRLLKLSLRRACKPDPALSAQLEKFNKKLQEEAASRMVAGAGAKAGGGGRTPKR